MPNGGAMNCGNCIHLRGANCAIRGEGIELPYWTFCWNFGRPAAEALGPVYAIVGEVRDRAVTYRKIPYFDGVRVETTQQQNGDTYLELLDGSGQMLRFETTTEYLDFYLSTGREHIG